jgi:hypothetical protein
VELLRQNCLKLIQTLNTLRNTIQAKECKNCQFNKKAKFIFEDSSHYLSDEPLSNKCSTSFHGETENDSFSEDSSK